MKTLVLIVCAIFISTMAIAQQNNYEYKLKPGVVYVFQTPEGELIIEGCNPSIDPWASVGVNPAFINPVDFAGPIALDPTAKMTVDPSYLGNIERLYPKQSPFEPGNINPSYINPIETAYPKINDPWSVRRVNPAYGNNWN